MSRNPYLEDEMTVEEIEREILVYTKIAKLEDELGHMVSARDHRNRIDNLELALKQRRNPKREPGLYEFTSEWGNRYFYDWDGDKWTRPSDGCVVSVEGAIGTTHTIRRIRELGHGEVAVQVADLGLGGDLDKYADGLTNGVGVTAHTAKSIVKRVAKAAKEAGL